MAIYDTMQYVRADVVTTCVGEAASMAAEIVCVNLQPQDPQVNWSSGFALVAV
jgi:hypothetical protein